MPGKRRLAPLMLSRRQVLGGAVAVVVLLYVAVAVWATLGRKPDPVSVAPAQPIFPGGVQDSAPPIPVLPAPTAVETPPTGSAEGDPASPAPSGGQPGGAIGEGSRGGGGDSGGHRDENTRPPADPPARRPPAIQPPDEPSPPVGPFTSRYTLTEDGFRTFHARVFLTNRGPSTRNWSVRITFASADRVSVGRTRGALKRSSGNTVVFSGFRARPGQTEIFGFDATKGVNGTVRPTGCEVDGRPCDIRIG